MVECLEGGLVAQALLPVRFCLTRTTITLLSIERSLSFRKLE